MPLFPSSFFDTPGLNIGIDFDRNIFICWESLPTDKLSTIPSYGLDALNYFNWKRTAILTGVTISTNVGISSLYGTGGIDVECDTTNSNGIIIGKDSVPSFNFTGLTNGRVYTVQFAIKRSSLEANGSRPMRLQLRTQSDTVTIATTDFDLAIVDTWYIVRANFTASAADSNLSLRIFKNGLLATAITYIVSGIMIFNETSVVAEQGFNLGTEISLNENISRRVIDCSTKIGMRPFVKMGDENVATLTCYSEDRFFSQEDTGAVSYGYMLPYTIIVIRYGTEQYYVGYTELYKPTPFLYGEQRATITCFGLKRYMETAKANVEYAASQRVDEYMLQVLDDFDSNIDNTEIGTALTTLAYYGDNAYDDIDEDINVYEAFKQLTYLEQGWFFINSEGIPEFLNRHTSAITPSTYTIDNTAQDIEYAPFGEFLINRVKVKVYPRLISSVTTDILWELDQPQVIKAGKLKRFRVPYTDSSSNMCGATDVSTPGGADFVSSGGSPFLTIVHFGQFSRVTIDNTTGTSNCTVTTLIVRGRSITYLNPIEVVAEDTDSITNYGTRELTYDMKGLADIDSGDDLANFVLLMRSQFRGDIKTVTLIAPMDSADADNQRAIDMGLVITVIDDQLGHEHEYFVIGVSHTYTENKMLTSKYTLEIAASDSLWVLGTSELGVSTGLGY